MVLSKRLGSRLFLAFILSFLSLFIYAQENCTNGIDDDGDGLIDLNDGECVCGNISSNTFIGDFEEYTCCPQENTWLPDNGIFCLDDGWLPGNTGTPDYFNTCGFLGGGLVPLIPLPIPSGEGAIGMLNDNTYHENVGYCFENITMISGNTYTLSFYIGFHADNGFQSDLDVDVNLLGTLDCANFPALSEIGFCQANYSEWSVITTVPVMGEMDNSWLYVEHTFTATMNAAAIIIALDCAGLLDQYHFFDDIQLTGEFVGEEIADEITSSGNCVDGVVLENSQQGGASYQWYYEGVAISGATSNTYTVPSADDEGLYQVMVINGASCAISPAYDVIINSNVLEINGVVTPISCASNPDGMIDITPESNNSPFNIIWSTGSIDEDIIDGSPGTYTVSVTDDNGCFGSAFFVIEEPELLDITTMGDCISGVSLEVDDGLSGATYQWYIDGVAIVGAVTNPYVIIDNANGAYTVEVTNGIQCFGSNPIQVEIDLEALSFSGEAMDLLCFGIPSGSVLLTIDILNNPYDISWENGEVSQEILNLEPGAYTVTVTDDNGCFGVQTYIVTEPSPFINILTVVQPDMGSTGQASIQSSGGTIPYTYSWSNGDNTATIDDLFPGYYFVTVTDGNGCTDIFEFEIVGDYLVAVSSINESCPGYCNGSAILSIEGPDVIYTIEWNDSNLSGFQVNDLCEGSYVYTVTDETGLTFIGAVDIIGGEAIVYQSDFEQFLCDSNAITNINLSISGGVEPYIVSWDTGATNDTLFDVQIGNYEVTITDGNECSVSDTFEILMYPTIDLSFQTTQAGCQGEENGAIEMTIGGGNPPYNISWSIGDTIAVIDSLSTGLYVVTVTDDNNCFQIDSVELNSNSGLTVEDIIVNANCVGEANGYIGLEVSGGTMPYEIIWSNGKDSSYIDSLLTGSYTVTITDFAGCSFISAYQVGLNSDIVIDVDYADNNCFDGAEGMIDLTVSNISSSYDVIWNNGIENEDVFNLTAGNYSYVLLDSFGCEYSDEFTISEGSELTYQTVIGFPGCNGAMDGLINLSLTTGEVPVSYLWSTGDTTNQISGLSSGIYFLTITDNLGCLTLDTFSISEESDIMVEYQVTNIDCHGDSTGNIELTITGGIPPYNVLWNTGSQLNPISNLPQGEFEVVVSDAINCSSSQIISVNQTVSLVILDSIVPPICFGDSGTVNLSIEGGTTPYSFEWSTGEMSNEIQLGAGETSLVTVTDALGCSLSKEYYFTDLSPISVSVLSTVNPGPTNDNGSISISVNGGVSPLDINWDNGASGEIITGLSTGTYIAYIEDANGCVDSISIIIGNEPLSYLESVQSNLCFGDCEGHITLEITGGVLPYNISWSNGGNTNHIENLCAGIYQATIVDNGGVEIITDEIDVLSPAEIIIDGIAYNVSCIDTEDGAISVDIEGGIEPFELSWSNSMDGDSIANLSAGAYAVTVMDENGCEENSIYTVEDISSIELSAMLNEIDCEIDYREVTIIGENEFNYPILLNGELANVLEDNVIADLSAGVYNLAYAINSTCIIPFEDISIAESPDYTLSLGTELVESLENELVIITLDIVSNAIDLYTIDWILNNDSECIEFDENGNCLSVSITTGVSEIIKVILTDINGCEYHTEVELRIKGTEDEIYFPNVFSPNGDGINDEFIISSNSDSIIISSVLIFDRWGNKVFGKESIEIQVLSWDGTYSQKAVVSGVYVYYVLALVNGAPKIYNGDLTLVR